MSTCPFCPISIYQRHVWNTATFVAEKKTVFASPSPSLLEKNYFCNNGSNNPKYVVNKLAFCQLSMLMQK
jgi:hypothetical protein